MSFISGGSTIQCSYRFNFSSLILLRHNVIIISLAYGDTEDPNDREFEIMLQEEKRQAMNLELNKLKRGIQETQVS